jgi:hypothetical protein
VLTCLGRISKELTCLGRISKELSTIQKQPGLTILILLTLVQSLLILAPKQPLPEVFGLFELGLNW